MLRRILSVRCWVRLAGVGIFIVLPTLAFAQNCALCYTQAAASGSRVIHALRSGIAILVIPPMAICIILTVMAYKKNNHYNDEAP